MQKTMKIFSHFANILLYKILLKIFFCEFIINFGLKRPQMLNDIHQKLLQGLEQTSQMCCQFFKNVPNFCYEIGPIQSKMRPNFAKIGKLKPVSASMDILESGQNLKSKYFFLNFITSQIIVSRNYIFLCLVLGSIQISFPAFVDFFSPSELFRSSASSSHKRTKLFFAIESTRRKLLHFSCTAASHLSSRPDIDQLASLRSHITMLKPLSLFFTPSVT